MSIIGTFFVKVKDGGSPHKALNIGEFGSAGLMLVASYFIINAMLPETWIDSAYGIYSNGCILGNYCWFSSWFISR